MCRPCADISDAIAGYGSSRVHFFAHKALLGAIGSLPSMSRVITPTVHLSGSVHIQTLSNFPTAQDHGPRRVNPNIRKARRLFLKMAPEFLGICPNLGFWPRHATVSYGVVADLVTDHSFPRRV